jgi:DNA-binding NarL/FixJ family response regulator
MSRCHSGMSHEEIGRILGMSRQNVQLIERKAMRKLRAACGSTYNGKWLPYDSEGVPEPAEGYQDRSRAHAQARRGGRFT